jgi:hypothetical protein
MLVLPYPLYLQQTGVTLPSVPTACWRYPTICTYSMLTLPHHLYLQHAGVTPPSVPTACWRYPTICTYSMRALPHHLYLQHAGVTPPSVPTECWCLHLSYCKTKTHQLFMSPIPTLVPLSVTHITA